LCKTFFTTTFPAINETGIFACASWYPFYEHLEQEDTP
jgi:hypothetical protein